MESYSAETHHAATKGFSSLAAAGFPRTAGLSVLRCPKIGQSRVQGGCSGWPGKVLHKGKDAVHVGRQRSQGRGPATGQMREPGGARHRRDRRPAL